VEVQQNWGKKNIAKLIENQEGDLSLSSSARAKEATGQGTAGGGTMRREGEAMK